MGYSRKVELKEGQILKWVKNESKPFYLGLSYEGLGIIRDFKVPIFVYNLLPDEEADIEITYCSKKCCFAKVKKYRTCSLLREKMEPSRVLLYETGSTPLAGINYENQLKFKQYIIKNLFERNLNYTKVLPILESNCQWFYRNKISLQIKYDEKGPKIGFFKKYSHDLVEQTEMELAVVAIREFYKKVLISPKTDFEKDFKNLIFQVKPFKITLRSPKSSFCCIEIILHIKEDLSPENIKLFEALLKDNLSYKVTFFNTTSNKWINLLNHNGIKYELGKLVFNVVNDTFYQINETVMNNIYKKISDWIPSNELNVLDAFGGVGTIACFIAHKCRKVYSVEINKKSSLMAIENIKENKISNIEVINDDANKWLILNKEKIDLVIFDPPREGLDSETIKSIKDSDIKKIIYLSCEPKTLVRDLQNITSFGYELIEVQPYDMFPQTQHIETLVLLEKKS
ncbi:23S rRNA (uracil(1939)-C(5))-methyltransferase RlmD [Mycoplasma sp. 2261]